jgi:asparagine synthase (glutamine-hydrolysing)
MCGIAGILRFDGAPIDRALIERMNLNGAHRGPDGDGLFLAPGVALGHRRLAILDLSPRGQQPMAWADGRYQIVFNGEIYNFIEIRAELEARGVRFSTGTDTEVILAAYQAWGEACLDRFNGMWAFAIFDALEQKLFLARDRFGVKPIHYVEGPGTFAFASEIKQLLPCLDGVQANQAAVLEWMLTTFENHREQTLFEGVMSMPGSHCMHIDLRSGRREMRRWYGLRKDPSIAGWNEPRAEAELRGLLEDSIRLRLRSDVQVGTCLSGGLDSSVISTIASSMYRRNSGGRFLGIHARATESAIDESRWARTVAECADIDLRLVAPSRDDFLSTLDDVVRTQEEPFSSASMFMGWHVFREARARNCPVMLNGQGGDEVFLGYERYFSAITHGAPVWRTVLAAWEESRKSRLGFWDALLYKLYFRFPAMRISRLRSRSYLLPDAQSRADLAFVVTSAQALRDVSDMQRLEIESLQLPHLLRYEDRNSMRHGIETRLPFLDFRLVEAGFSMRANLKIRNGWTKWVLRRAVSDLLPGPVVWRTNKFGFEAPMKTWMDDCRDRVLSAVADSPIISATCNRNALLRDWDRVELWQRWKYFCLASWERVFGVRWT